MVKIFVGNLSEDTTAEQLRSLFSQYGTISECDVLKKYGFVHMDDKAEADEAIRRLHHHQLNGQTINVEMSRGKTKNSTKLHVGNISSSCTNQELRARFEEFGPVVECDIVKDYAFVHMERVEDAMEAINGLDNTAFQGKLMSVKLSTSRLRTAPGMGDRTGCYRCGQDGHWSKECPMDQNGSFEAGANGFGPSRFGGGGGGRGGFPRGLGGDPGYGGTHGGPPSSHAFVRGPVFGGGGGPGYGRVAGYDGGMAYRAAAAGYGAGGDGSASRAFGGDAAYGSGPGFAAAAAAAAYPPRRAAMVEDRDPYNVVDFYEKYRARPYATGFYDETQQRVAALAPPPPPSLAPAGASLDPYDRRALPAPSAAVPSYYARDRSPVRRAPSAAQGYAFERSRLSPTGMPRSAAYDGMRARDPYADRVRYAF
ncbi:RNA-binding protein 4.1-like isoform X1 [Conger conger]|uniref:RNA-binding protein 4.1-like isoform X1 n=1 Tax=Conger conger TaxID=82655 RepID=UPI002A5A7A5B|nr:RNA-binding protein 4.1-like isoform X1 [Conger conger]